MRTSDQINELAAALAKAQAKIEGAAKDRENPHFRQKYADLGAVWDAIRGPLTENGLSITQWLRAIDGGVEVETLLLHASGQFISDVFAVPVGKQDAQGYGSAATYCRRYSLMAAVGVAPVDDDGQAAVSSNGNGKAFTPAGKTPAKPLPPPPVQNGAGTIPAATNDEAAETFTTQSIEAIGKMRHQEELAAWWRKNARHIERLGAKYPALHYQLVVAADEMRARLPHVTQAA